MNRLTYLAFALAIAAAGCSNNNSLTSTTPTPNAVTIDFTDATNGPLTRNGSQTFTFTTVTSGIVTATLQDLEPDGPNLLPVGLSLGIFDSTANCQRVVYRDNAIKSTSLTAQATAPGTFCVTLYDSTGNLPQPQTFDIQVSHP